MGRRRWVTAGLLGAFGVLRVVASAGTPVRFPDTGTYLPLNFLGGANRLWTVPLVWSLADADWLRVAVQVALGVVAWSMLALALGRIISSVPLRWAAMVSVLILGLTPQIVQWDRALLSESLATSLLVLLIALLLRAASGRGPRLIFGTLAVATLWIFTRQENALLFLCLLPVLLGYVAWRLRGRERAAVVLALVAMGAWSGVALTADTPASRRVEVWNSVQIVENRIAVSPPALAYFEARGLPPTRFVAEERGAFPGSASPLFSDRAFMRWIDGRFQSVYSAYLLSQWRNTLEEPFAQLWSAISDPTPSITSRDVLPGPLQRTLDGSRVAIVLSVLLAAAALALVIAARATVRALPLMVLLALFSGAGAVLTWNLTGYGPGDDSLARLFLPIAITVRLGSVVALALSLDALLCRVTRAQAAVVATLRLDPGAPERHGSAGSV